MSNKKKQRMAASPEVVTAMQNSATPAQLPAPGSAIAAHVNAKQGKAKPDWGTYDAKTRGGEGFDGKDIKYLSKQGWSHNDIMRAAAASGNVAAGADQRLRKLNTQSVGFDKVPKSVRKRMQRDGGLGFVFGARNSQFTYLGGDRNDVRNWRVAEGANPMAGKGLEGAVINMLGSRSIDKLNRKGSKEVLTWQGINADGSANALTGTKYVRGKDGELKNKDITWRLPDKQVDTMRQNDFNQRMEEYNKQNPAKPEAKPAPAEPAPRFNPSDWGASSVAPQSQGSGNSSGSGNEAPAIDTTPKLFNSYLAGGNGFEGGRGDFTAGFEAFAPGRRNGSSDEQRGGSRFASSRQFRERLERQATSSSPYPAGN